MLHLLALDVSLAFTALSRPGLRSPSGVVAGAPRWAAPPRRKFSGAVNGRGSGDGCLEGSTAKTAKA